MIPPAIQAILLGVIVVVFGLNRLARAFPDVEWLQKFRLPTIELSEEEKARRRRRANLMAGFEIILAGLVLPLLYLASKVMMFNEPTTFGLIIVGSCSLTCLGLGGWVIARSFRQTK
jgi:uncharacterized membrane protein YqjE